MHFGDIRFWMKPGDNNEALTCCGDDLFPQQSANPIQMVAIVSQS
jgi:hypothetical protein